MKCNLVTFCNQLKTTCERNMPHCIFKEIIKIAYPLLKFILFRREKNIQNPLLFNNIIISTYQNTYYLEESEQPHSNNNPNYVNTEQECIRQLVVIIIRSIGYCFCSNHFNMTSREIINEINRYKHGWDQETLNLYNSLDPVIRGQEITCIKEHILRSLENNLNLSVFKIESSIGVCWAQYIPLVPYNPHELPTDHRPNPPHHPLPPHPPHLFEAFAELPTPSPTLSSQEQSSNPFSRCRCCFPPFFRYKK